MRFRITYATRAELAAEVKQMAHGGVLVRDPAAAHLPFDTPVVLELVMPDKTTLVSGGKVLQALAGLGVAVTIEPHIVEQARKLVDATPPESAPPARAASPSESPPRTTTLAASTTRPPATTPPAGTSTKPPPIVERVRATTPPAGTSTTQPRTSTIAAPLLPRPPATVPPAVSPRTATIASPMPLRAPASPSTPPATASTPPPASAPPPPIADPRTMTLASPMILRTPATPAAGSSPSTSPPPLGESAPPPIADPRTMTLASPLPLRPPAPTSTAGEESEDVAKKADARESGEPTRAQKIQLALHGTRDQRNAMLRDRDRGLHAFVLKNPGITLDDVLAIAKNSMMGAEVFKQISERADWFQRPQIALALARNHKVPSEIAIRALAHVAPDALRQLAKGAGAPPHVVQAARKRVIGDK